MDFERINIYNYTKFELGSNIRNKRFRFIRYTGDNYAEIVSYIHEVSPNTDIWPERNMVKGTLYHYSGRNFQMNYANEVGLRAIIVNNPYIIIDDEWVSLAMSNVEAEQYLALNPLNSVFRPDKPFSTYRKDFNTLQIIEHNQEEHPKGLDFQGLQPNEYYICKNVISQANVFSFHYDKDFHELQISPLISPMVKHIEELKYQINVHSIAARSTPLFIPTWDNWKKIDTMSKRCLTSRQLKEVIKCVYSSLMDEIQEDCNLGKYLLDNVCNHHFIELVRDLLNCDFDHVAPTVKQQEFFMNCLDNNDGPYCPSDFQALQIALYKKYTSFLKYVLGLLVKPKIGRIKEDDTGHLFCCNVQLASFYSPYKGCICEITKYTENNNEKSNYKYYSETIDLVHVAMTGTVETGKKGAKVVGNYFVPETANVHIGDSVTIKEIKPTTHGKSFYAGYVVKIEVNHNNVDSQFENSPIKDFINVDDGDGFLKFLHEKIESNERGKDCILLVRAACEAKKIAHISSGKESFKKFNKEFPNMFGGDKNWSKYMNPKLWNDEVKELVSLFADW